MRKSKRLADRAARLLQNPSQQNELRLDERDDTQAVFATAQEGLAAAAENDRQGQTDAALANLKQVTRQFPDTLEAWERAIGLLVRDRRLDEAEVWLTAGRPYCGHSFHFLHSAGQVAQMRNDWDVAVRRWEEFRTQFSDIWYGFVHQATCLRILGRLDEADAVLLEGQSRLPTEAPPFLEYPRAAEARRDWEEAIRRWMAARDRFPDHPLCYLGAAACLRQLGRYADADSLLLDGHRQCANEPQLLADYARNAEAARDWEQALSRWAEFRTQFPDNPMGYTGAAGCLRELKRFDEATALLLEGQSRNPNDPSLFVDQARIAEIQRDWDEARRRWSRVIERFPANWVGYSGAVGALRELRRFDEADAVLVAGQQQIPHEPVLLMDHARVAEARGYWAEAAHRWGIYRTRFPGTWYGYANAAVCLRRLGRHDEADTILLEGQQRLPHEAPCFMEYPASAEAQGNWEEALRRWHDIAQRFPSESRTYTGPANCLRHLRRYDEADAQLAAGQQKCPHEPAVFMDYARNAEARGDWAAALGRWNEVRTRFPAQSFGYARAAACLAELQRYDEADAVLAEALARFPTEFYLYADSARLAARRLDQSETIRRWKEARERFPHERDGWINEANSLADNGRSADAITHIQEAQARFPDNFEVRCAAAALYARLHLLEQSLAAWDSVRQDFPDRSAAYIHGAYALQEAGRSDAAEAVLTDAMQRFPGDLEVNRAFATVAVRRNDLVAATERLATAVEQNKSDLQLAWLWVDSLRQQHRTEEARSAMHVVMQRFPGNPGVVQQAIRIVLQSGDRDEAVALWTATIGDPLFPRDHTYRMAWDLLNEGMPPQHAQAVLRHLATEPDAGGRDWRPLLADMTRLAVHRPDVAKIAAEFVLNTPADAFTPVVLDVLRATLRFEQTEPDLHRLFATYLANERMSIAASLFSNLVWSQKDGYPALVRSAFESYTSDRLRDTAWMTEDRAGEVVALLQFAAVASHVAYRDIAHAAASRFDVHALAARDELQTSLGILGSILAAATRPAAPSIGTVPRKLRVALCISGQLRGYRQAYETWAPLRLEQHDTTIFVDSWSAVGRNWHRIWTFLNGEPMLQQALIGGGLGFIGSRYPGLAKALTHAMTVDGTATVAQLQEFYGTPHVKLEDDADIAFSRRSNLWKMYYKMAAAHRAAQHSGQTFDMVIRARPDREIVDVSGFDLQELRARSEADNTVFVLDHPNVIQEGRFWLGDQFAFGVPSVMTAYCNMLPDIEVFAKIGHLPRGIDLNLPMHATPFLMMFYRGILARPIPGVEFGAFLDPPLLAVPEMYDLLARDIQERTADDFDLRLLRACELVLQAGR